MMPILGETSPDLDVIRPLPVKYEALGFLSYSRGRSESRAGRTTGRPDNVEMLLRCRRETRHRRQSGGGGKQLTDEMSPREQRQELGTTKGMGTDSFLSDHFYFERIALMPTENITCI